MRRVLGSRFLLIVGITAPAVALTVIPAFAAPATPTIKTTASAAVTVGGTISDSAVLAGGASPTGTITFQAFGPNNTTCSGSPTFSSTVTVTGNKSYVSSNFTTSAAGTYRFVATYSGDAANAKVTEPCGSAGESVTVSLTKPTLTTTAWGSVQIGHTIADSAVLASGKSPTGTITFSAYGPNVTSCTGTPALTAIVAVGGNSTYHSGNLTPKTAGTYRFVATYSGDAANAAVTDPCNAANESVTVTQVAPKLNASTSAGGPVGHAVSGTAVISGGYSPTGTVTFTFFAPDATTCTGTPASTSSIAVAGNGTYHSAAYTPENVGTYRVITAYSGDANNVATATTCGAANESVTVTQATSSLSLTISSLTTTYGDEQSESISAVVTSGDPAGSSTGTVQVLEQGSRQPVCTITLTNGSGSCALSSMQFDAGRYTVFGSYLGSSNVKPSTSSTHQFVVRQASTHTSLRVSRHHVRFGHEHKVQLNVTVTTPTLATAPEGYIVIRGGGGRLCGTSLSLGQGSCRLGRKQLSAGHHRLVAKYLGQVNSHASRSTGKYVRVKGSASRRHHVEPDAMSSLAARREHIS